MFGIQLVNCEGNTFLNNNVNSNARGISSITSNKNIISRNSASNNSAYGMWISQSHDNNIAGNTVNESGTDGAGGGIHFNSSSRNVISGNTVAFNYGSGLFECPGCHNNVVYNNYVNNAINANIKTRDTTWNKPKTEGTNVVGGPYIGGNFWATPAGTGFSETALDRDGDGISDTEYNASNLNITDKLPLVSGKSKLPVANLNTNVNSGYAPLSVQFSDLSRNATGRNWDFNNDGVTDSSEVTATYTYAVHGTYIVRLTAINAEGTTSTLTTITVLEQSGPVLPVANFSTNVSSGDVPLAVQFTDLSQNIVSRSWDFDNDGIKDSQDSNPVHLYELTGNYTVNLTVSNGNGTNSKLATISVLGGGNGNETQGLPVVELNANVTSGYVPLAVQFTDLSPNISSRNWDIGNDGTIEDINASFVYVFNSRGKYPVKLTIGNENGTSSQIIYINAQKKSSGGSSGGGGGGGSPEPAKNVKVKELSQVFISSGKSVKFDLAKNATAIVSLNFDSKKTVGKTTTIVEMLKNKSPLTPDAPEGEVYNYLNIWVGNGGYGSDEDNLENAVVNFRVEKSWLQEKGIDRSSIVLNRYSDKKWNELLTTLLSEDEKYLYFKAETPGFSPFSITGEATAKELDTETQSEIEDLNDSNGSTAAETEQKPEGEENTGTSEEEGMSTPGFEMIYGVAGFLAVFLYKRK
jgi:PGF-pre-PGF domain-containing protein